MDQEPRSDTESPTSQITSPTASSEDILLSALEEGDFDTVLQVTIATDSVPIRVGPAQLTPLHYACQHGRLDIVQLLLDRHEYDLQKLSNTIPTPLHSAAAHGHDKVVTFLLENGANAHLKTGTFTPLHFASKNGHLAVVEILSKANATQCCVPDHEGNMPLHHASAGGHLEVATFLCNALKHSLCPKNKKGETPLHLAAKQGHFHLMKFFVDEKGCDPCSKDGKIGCTPMHLAARNGSLEIVQYLASEKNCNAECKTSVRSRTKSRNVIAGMTPLHYATFAGHLDIAMFLVQDQQCNPHCSDEVGSTPLHLACQQGHQDLANFFLEHDDTDVNLVVTEDGRTPLHSAAAGGNLEIVRLLVERGCSASKVDSESRTPLHFAARNGNTEIVQYLCEENACNVNCVDQTGVTPLHQAAQYGHMESVKYLVSTPLCNPSCTEENGYTPLHLAANKGQANVVEFLVKEKHASVNSRDKIGRTPLHHAAQCGHLDIVQFLTSHSDCDPSCQDKSLKATPLHLASSFGHTDVVRYLINEKGCSPTSTDKFNSTPIHRAAGGGHLGVMHFLVKEKQCSSVVKNKFGNTPLHLACQKGHVEMVKLLLSYSTENILLRNQVGRMPLDLTSDLEILSEFLKLGVDPSKSSIATRYAYLKHWGALYPMVKVFLFGDIGTGKSTLVKAMQGGNILIDWMPGRFQRSVSSPSLDTAGISPTLVESRHFGKIVLYDFSGHPSYHTGHSAVLSMAAQGCTPLFMFAVDLRQTSEQIEQSVSYWASLVSAAMSAGDIIPQVIVVGTHEDELSKEEFRHKPAVLENVTSSKVNSVNFVAWLTLDCRKTNSTSMTKLKQLVSQKCYSIRAELKQDHRGSLLKSFIDYKFQGTIIVEFRELQEFISHTEIPDIKEQVTLYQACETLHTHGYILLLRNSTSIEDSWIILNQRAVLSLIHGFQMQLNLSNSLGLVPISQLEETLGLLGFNLALVIRYFLRMEFCVKIADRKVLHTIIGFDPPHPLEDHLFFPHLVCNEFPQEVWKPGEEWANQFGWCMECTEPKQFLGPRFTQVLLLRLSLSFPFNTNPNSLFVTRRLSCSLWENGMSWVDARGIETVVDVVDHSRAVLLMTRLQKGSSFEMDHVFFRSLILKKIRSIKEEICPRIQTTESILCSPHQVNLSLFHEKKSVVQPLAAFSMSEIVGAILNPTVNSVSSDHSIVLKSHDQPNDSLDTEQITMKLDSVVHHEPYDSLQPSILRKLFKDSSHDDNIISDDDLRTIGECFSNKSQSLTLLARMLQLPHSVIQAIDNDTNMESVNKISTILKRWGDRNNNGTFSKLRQVFDQYSVLTGTDFPLSVE